MGQIQSVIEVVLGRIIGFVIFVVLLLGANWLTSYIGLGAYVSVVDFLNNSLYIIIIFTLLLLIGEAFGVLMFPYNLPSPLFNAIGGIFLVKFIFDLIILIESIMNVSSNLKLNVFKNIAYVLVFLLVIIIGYAKILIAAGKIMIPGILSGTPSVPSGTSEKPVQQAGKPAAVKKGVKTKKQAGKKR